MRCLCRGREDNPAQTDVFNLMVANLKERNPKWGRASLDCERSTARIVFMEENSNGERRLN